MINKIKISRNTSLYVGRKINLQGNNLILLILFATSFWPLQFTQSSLFSVDLRRNFSPTLSYKWILTLGNESGIISGAIWELQASSQLIKRRHNEGVRFHYFCCLPHKLRCCSRSKHTILQNDRARSLLGPSAIFHSRLSENCTCRVLSSESGSLTSASANLAAKVLFIFKWNLVFLY